MSRACWQLSVVVPEAAVGIDAVGNPPVSNVGRAKRVGLGRGVGLGISVGGTSVAAGMAAWVIATIVLAAATAEACICAGSTAGVA